MLLSKRKFYKSKDWFESKSPVWWNNSLCKEIIDEFWEIPEHIKEITVELHDNSVAGSYLLELADRHKRSLGCVYLNNEDKLIPIDWDFYDDIMSVVGKRPRVYVRILY